MNNHVTHIVMQDTQNDVDSLYNAQTGRLIAGRVQNQVIVGDNPNPEKTECRRFLDQSYAKEHIRLLADEDWAATGAKLLRCDCAFLEDGNHMVGCVKHPSTTFAANIDYRNGTKMIAKPSSGDVSRITRQ